jgi:LPXTG-motif cell wall-anchored protein
LKKTAPLRVIRKKNIGSGASNTPKGSGGNKSESVIVRKYSVNQSSESSKKILPKTGSSSSQLLIFVGVLLIIGSFILIKQTNAIRK